jgi:hypothetical protein
MLRDDVHAPMTPNASGSGGQRVSLRFPLFVEHAGIVSPGAVASGPSGRRARPLSWANDRPAPQILTETGRLNP